MFYLFKRLLIISLMSFSFQVLAEEPLRVHDKGLDGDTRIFMIHCPNGSRASVSATYTSTSPGQVDEVCTYPAHGQMSCRDDWSVDEAAEFACQ